MSNIFWHRFNHADYLAKTSRLTPAQRGAHISLVCQYWVHGKLPASDEQLARITGMSSKEWQQNKAALQEFFSADWKSAEIEAEIADAALLYERQSRAGRKANAARWERSKGFRNGSKSQSESDPIYSTAQHSTAHEGPSQGEGTPWLGSTSSN